MNIRERLKDKQRIVIKIGSSSLVHAQTGRLNLPKIEILAREVADLRNQGKDVTLVSSGAIAVGRAAMKLDTLHTLKQKQACAAIGQVKLMMIYQKFFSEYGQTAAQLLLTKATLMDPESRVNSMNTFEELFALGVIPVVNENDSVETYEIRTSTASIRMIPKRIRRQSLFRRSTSWTIISGKWARTRPGVISEPVEWQQSSQLRTLRPPQART